MKYLTIKKWYPANYDANKNPEIFWFVNIKPEYTKDYHSRKYIKLGEKAESYLKGEIDRIVHAGIEYDLCKVKFTTNGFPVYMLSVNNVPKFFLFKYKKEMKWITKTGFIADEDLEFFESYGYEIDDHNIK